MSVVQFFTKIGPVSTKLHLQQQHWSINIKVVEAQLSVCLYLRSLEPIYLAGVQLVIVSN